jgi:hypothetical protein
MTVPDIETVPDAEPTEVWYVAYGSNLSLERFTCYLTGGRPQGAIRTYSGARDRRTPLDIRPVRLPGTVYFALQSMVWGGGMAFFDAVGSGTVAARAYRLRCSQFADVAAQEMHRDPLADLDLRRVMELGRWSYGPGRYETIVRLGELEDAPLLTLTAPWGVDGVRHAAPSREYLAVIAAGLRESYGWSRQQVADHLVDMPGVQPAWSRDSVLGVCR